MWNINAQSLTAFLKDLGDVHRDRISKQHTASGITWDLEEEPRAHSDELNSCERLSRQSDDSNGFYSITANRERSEQMF